MKPGAVPSEPWDEPHPTLAAYRAHETAIDRGGVECGIGHCPYCHHAGNSTAEFRRHAVRVRLVLIIVHRSVLRLPLRLLRWRCPRCKRTFTEYPTFLVPRKQYASPELRKQMTLYRFGKSGGLRRVVRVLGMPIFHSGSARYGMRPGPHPPMSVHVLAHTTLYRWLKSA